VLYGTTFGGGGASHQPFLGYGTVFALSPPVVGQTAWMLTTLYRFSGTNGDGAFPDGRLIQDASGALYGTTNSGGATGNGAVYQLKPPAVVGGTWTESVLYSFRGGRDGSGPETGLAADASGALYGTTFQGGAYQTGVVYRLARRGASWVETVIHTFNNGPHDGGYPTTGPLVVDAAGSVYGTTQHGGISCAFGCGVVYELRPPPSTQFSWIETIVHFFRGGPDGAYPTAGLTLRCGELVGTTGGGFGEGGLFIPGTVFTLTPPGGGGTAWTENILHQFYVDERLNGLSPNSLLVADRLGTLYGTTYSGGTNSAGVVYALLSGTHSALRSNRHGSEVTCDF
jgi:uncharacterized repeat protein (TIGR03803 family)